MKPLSQLLAEVEPKFYGMFAIDIPAVDRASYDKLKAIAVALAKAYDLMRDFEINKADEQLTTAREMLGDE